jgi:hypothetical protein
MYIVQVCAKVEALSDAAILSHIVVGGNKTELPRHKTSDLPNAMTSSVLANLVTNG